MSWEGNNWCNLLKRLSAIKLLLLVEIEQTFFWFHTILTLAIRWKHLQGDLIFPYVLKSPFLRVAHCWFVTSQLISINKDWLMTSLVIDTWVIHFIQQKAINVKLKGSYINTGTSLSFHNNFYLFTSIRSFISNKKIHVKKTLDSHFKNTDTSCLVSDLLGKAIIMTRLCYRRVLVASKPPLLVCK